MNTLTHTVLSNLKHFPSEDVDLLFDAMCEELKERGLMLKTHEPGYASIATKKWRKNAQKKHGRNYELISYRKRNHWTQVELASRLNVPQSHISAFETGVRKTPEWITEYIRKEGADESLQRG